MNERGAYLTGNRAEALGREIAELEGRLQTRIDRLEAELAALSSSQSEALRGQVRALIEVLHVQKGPV